MMPRPDAGHGPLRTPRPSPHEHVLPRRALSILIVARNAAGEIDSQLAMLSVAARYRDWQVIVVDNHSSDGTAELIERRHPWAHLIRCPINTGYAAACNLAARHADGALLLFLHTDTLAQPAMIARAAARMLVNPQVGIAGGRLVGDAGQDMPASHRFPSVLADALDWHDTPGNAREPADLRTAQPDPLALDPASHQPARNVDWVSDAFAMIRHDVFRYLDGFDPRFFMYCEDIDLCRRVRAIGFEVAYWPDVRAHRVHRHGGLPLDRLSVQQHERWRLQSRLLYYRKHRGPACTWLASRVADAWLALVDWRCQWHATSATERLRRDARARRAQLDAARRATDGGRASPPGPWC